MKNGEVYRAMEVETILQMARDLGITLRLDRDNIKYAPKSLATDDFVAALRQSKAEILACLNATSEGTSLYDLPFPVGYGGLPTAQVEMAEAWLDKVEIRDPILRKYNVVTWVRSHLQWNGRNQGELYKAIRQEQQRLGRILSRRAWDR